MAESPEDLQKSLTVFSEYCEKWKLKINTDKSKILIFGSKLPKNKTFYIKDIKLDIVDSYKYLGIIFCRNGSFLQAKKTLISQAKKGMTLLKIRIRNLNLPIDCQLRIFDSTIVPILLYSSEIWGFGNNQNIEQIQLTFLKDLLKLRKSTPLPMIYGELGVFPLDIKIKTKMLSFWATLITGKASKISATLYRFMLHETVMHGYKFKWLTDIVDTLNKLGMGNYWLNQNIMNKNAFVHSVSKRLKDQYRQIWNDNLNVYPKCITYRIFKSTHSCETYLFHLPDKLRTVYVRFRTSNHYLPIETGRWQNIERQDRICPLCNTALGDEYHYLFQCPYFTNERSTYLNRYYYNRPNTFKFQQLFNSRKLSVTKKLCMFLNIINTVFKNMYMS